MVNSFKEQHIIPSSNTSAFYQISMDLKKFSCYVLNFFNLQFASAKGEHEPLHYTQQVAAKCEIEDDKPVTPEDTTIARLSLLVLM